MSLDSVCPLCFSLTLQTRGPAWQSWPHAVPGEGCARAREQGTPGARRVGGPSGTALRQRLCLRGSPAGSCPAGRRAEIGQRAPRTRAGAPGSPWGGIRVHHSRASPGCRPHGFSKPDVWGGHPKGGVPTVGEVYVRSFLAKWWPWARVWGHRVSASTPCFEPLGGF